MPQIGYDAANPNIPAELAKQPVVICAYTDGNYSYDAAEVAAIHAAGVAVLLNHERAANQLLGGHAAGVQAASDALTAAARLGVPMDGTVALCFSMDQSIPSTQYETVGQAFDGINSVLAGKLVASCYGQGGLIDYLATSGRTHAKGWLSGSISFPGYNRASPNVGMWQHVGSDVANTDLNTVTDLAGLRPWYAAGAAPLGSGTPLTSTDTTEENDMANVPDQQWSDVYQRTEVVWGLLKGLDQAALTALVTNAADNRVVLQDVQSRVEFLETDANDKNTAILEIAGAVGKLVPGAADTDLSPALAEIHEALLALASRSFTITGSAS